MSAIKHANRAYIFDNSGENETKKHHWLAEITDGRLIQFKSDQIPDWFNRNVLEKIFTG
jgi:hypothetical protein